MTKYLLDSNHASPLVTIGHPLRGEILKRLDQGDTFGLCVPVITETMFGIGVLPRAKANLAEWERLKPMFPQYGLNGEDAENAVRLQLSLRKIGRQLAPFDSLIAVTAIRHQLTLLTTDQDFNPIDDLAIENWLVQI